MATIEDDFNVMADKISSEIAEEANKCCNRSDGYEEDIKTFALEKIKKLIDHVVEVCY